MRIFSRLVLWAVVAQAARSQTVDDFFDGSVLHDIYLTMATADWQSLKDQYLDNTYYPCDLEWRGIKVTHIGVRSRGSGTRNPIKPSLGFDMSRYVSKQRFLDLKGFDTRNFAEDPSMVHERLTMMMFAKIGLPYLREAHARIYVNGEYVGVYLTLEPVDSRFLTTHVGENDGYLYDFQWTGTPYRFEYLGDDPSLYVPVLFEPKTNEDAPDAGWIVDMIRTINQAPDTEFAAAVGKYIDLDSFMAHLAAEQFMAEYDGILGETGMTNFYFYRRNSDNRGLFFGWDKDQTFSATDRSIWQGTADNVLMRRALQVPRLKQRYLETLAEAARVAGGKGGWFDQQRLLVYDQIKQAAADDPVRVCVPSTQIDSCPFSLFEMASGWVSDFAQGRSAFVESELRSNGYQLPAGALVPGAAANAASGVPLLAPGALIEITTTLALQGGTAATSLPLPAQLAGVQVLIGGLPAPLVRVSPLGALVQAPWELPLGPTGVQIVTNGSAGNVITGEVRPAAVGIYVVTHADGLVVSAANPARGGELLVAWVTGLGPGEQPLTTGAATPMAAIRTGFTVTARVGTLPATVVWSGFTPGMVGLQQVLFQAPAALTGAGTYPLALTANEEAGVPYSLSFQ